MLGTDLSGGQVVMDEPAPEKERKVETAKQLISQVKRQSRRRVSAEDKVRIVMEGLRGEISISDLCRREKITKPAYYRWLKSFLEAGKGRLKGDSLREANSDEVQALKEENDALKRLLAEQMLVISRLKKSHLE
jgi:transposase